MEADTIRLFHITAIKNLDDISRSGAILCKSTNHAQGIAYQNIAHAGAQGARAGKAVPNPPGGMIHDFVPFYFAPRSPMLYAINGGNVANCNLRQEDILHFETNVQQISQLGNDIVFYDRNATLRFSIPYTDISLLPTVVDWSLITETPCRFCKYFHNMPSHSQYVDRMEKRQAEFLVKQRVPLTSIAKIGVMSQEAAKKVGIILAKAGIKLAVEVKTDWYFLGQ